MYTLDALFIDETFLKDKTPINDNIDIRLIVPFVGNAQDIDIQPLLGSNLYNRLQNGIIANDLNANEIKLLEIIRPALAYFSLYRAIPFIAVEVRGAGIVRHVNEKIQPASSKDIDMIRNEAMNTAEFYAKRIVNWLCANRTMYPEFNTETMPLKPSKGNYAFGMYYDESGSGCCKF